MYTLSFSFGLADSEKIIESMKKIDPKGTHRIVGKTDEMQRLITDAKPDVVWLAAEDKNFALAEKSRKGSPRTNFIFVAKTPDRAIDAIRVRASGFVLTPVTESAVRRELAEFRYPVSENEALLTVRCFGSFEVFSKGRIIRFARSLSKEAFAYMVDRRGAGCTVAEICAVLWENRPVDRSLKSQCRVILASLKKDLEAVGAEEVLVKGWNTWGVDADLISCDYFDYLRDADNTTEAYLGEYMSQYSWAEMTSGNLYRMALSE